MKVPGNERSRERKFQGTKVPLMELSFLETKVLCYKSSSYHHHHNNRITIIIQPSMQPCYCQSVSWGSTSRIIVTINLVSILSDFQQFTQQTFVIFEHFIAAWVLTVDPAMSCSCSVLFHCTFMSNSTV